MPLTPKQLLEAQIKQLILLYGDAGDRVNKLLQGAALTDFKRFQYGQYDAQLKKIITALNIEADRIAKGVSKLSYKEGMDVAAEALKESGIDVGPVSMGAKIHTSALSAVSDQMTLDYLSANGSIEKDAKRILRMTQQKAIEEKAINDTIARGVIEGETRRAVSKRLTEQIQEAIGDGAKVVINGRRYDPAKYSELVSRTRTRECATEGMIRMAQEYDVVLFQWSFHEGACEICQRYQGKVYSLMEGQGYPVLEARPPVHPNCKHVLLPLVSADDEENEQMQRISNMRGFVRDGDTYDRALKGGKLDKTPIAPDK